MKGGRSGQRHDKNENESKICAKFPCQIKSCVTKILQREQEFNFQNKTKAKHQNECTCM